MELGRPCPHTLGRPVEKWRAARELSVLVVPVDHGLAVEPDQWPAYHSHLSERRDLLGPEEGTLPWHTGVSGATGQWWRVTLSDLAVLVLGAAAAAAVEKRASAAGASGPVGAGTFAESVMAACCVRPDVLYVSATCR